MMLVVAALLLTLPGAAAAQARHPCKPTRQLDLSLSRNSVVSCKTAQAVESYSDKPRDRGFCLLRRRAAVGRGTIYSRAHGHTYYVFVSPGKRIGIVWVTVRLGVS